jgi:hypothetical protein
LGSAKLKNRRRYDDEEQAHMLAGGLYIPSAGHFLTALARLLSFNMELFGFQVVARSVMECSARAWWLVDADATEDVRLARHYVDRLDNLNQAAKPVPGSADEVKVMKRELITQARESGLTPTFSKRNSNHLVGFNGVTKIKSTELSGRFFKAIGFIAGEAWYQTFSAVVHGTPNGLLQYLKFDENSAEEFQPLIPSLDIESVRQAAILSTQAYLGAIEFDCRHLGRDGDFVAKYRREVFERMTSIPLPV